MAKRKSRRGCRARKGVVIVKAKGKKFRCRIKKNRLVCKISKK